MYKVTIEEVIGEIRRISVLETDDVELVKLVLKTQSVIEVDSDIPNLNIDPEWQELMDWYRKQKEKPAQKDPYESILERIREMEKEANKRGPMPPFSPQPYVSPFTTPYDPSNPFIVKC